MSEQIVRVKTFGPPTCKSPFSDRRKGVAVFVPEGTFVRYRVDVSRGDRDEEDPLFEKAGPRARLFFDPGKTRAAVVTCGGLSPGLNNVIRSIVLELHHNYGAPEVLGIRYGYRGMNPKNGHDPIVLTPALVEATHKHGGTMLGTSRGSEDVQIMADFLERHRIDILFCVGGDGTLRGAHQIHEELEHRALRTAIVGVPKTIDNDIPYCLRTFGYFTALEVAREVLAYAHNEARSVFNGIGLVKVMGRDAGFIAAGATLASQEVNFTLIPEVPFELSGPKGFLESLKERLLDRHHALIVVAEGAGQHLFMPKPEGHDASGNPYRHDIGPYLKEKISEFMRAEKVPFDLKYIDPSYIIRSVPANSEDSMLCDQFARNAVHAGMAGRTDVMVGFANAAFFHAPLELVSRGRKRVETEGEMWASVLAATGQAPSFV